MKIKKALKWFALLLIFAITLRYTADFVVKKIFYPLKYEEYIYKSSEENGLDPYFVMAVIKAESNYDPEAHSGVARGLMQLTDGTAFWIAGKMEIEFDERDLEDPKTNISMGCYYLKYLSDLYHDETLLLASYNAGMGNVESWLGDARYSADSKKLDYIPFEETRDYVKKVVKYKEAYKKIYNADRK